MPRIPFPKFPPVRVDPMIESLHRLRYGSLHPPKVPVAFVARRAGTPARSAGQRLPGPVMAPAPVALDRLLPAWAFAPLPAAARPRVAPTPSAPLPAVPATQETAKERGRQGALLGG